MVKIDTYWGEVTVQAAMFDTDGTNLESGVEIKLNDVLIGEQIGEHLSKFEDFDSSDMEHYLTIKNLI